MQFALKVSLVPKKKNATWKQQYQLFSKWEAWANRAVTKREIGYSLLGKVVADMQGIW